MKFHKRTKPLSIISSLNNNQHIAPFVFEGSCTREVFELYIERVLIPNLKKGKTVIFDNASFHKGGSIKKLIEDAGCHLLYLPPYSPDFNPIEHHWFACKNYIRKYLLMTNRNIYLSAKMAFKKLSYL